MELSIIVPVYNMAADGKLEYCLNSLLNQTITDFEIIAVDDASTDQSPQILLEYAAHYPDVMKVYLSPENRKQGGAKNIGLKHARGKWIGFVDSDDWVAPDMYEKLLQKAYDTGADMVACNYHLTYEHSEAIGKVIKTHCPEQTGVLDEDKYRLLLLDLGSLVIKIYKRRLIYDCGMQFPEHMFYEDNAIANAIVLQSRHFEYIDEPLYYYYQHGASTVHTINMDRLHHRMEASRIMLRHAEEHGYLDTYREELEFKFTELFYVNTMFGYLQSAGKKDIAFLKALQQEMAETFPNFQVNSYYKERIGEEERYFIAMQQSSTRRMLAWYEFKWFVRRLRKKGLRALLPGLCTMGLALVGILLALAIAGASMVDRRELVYPVVLLGDSIIANDYVGDELDAMLSDGLGEPVFNGGFGGSYLSNQNVDYDDTCGEESLSMEEIANSMVTGDFLVQKSTIRRVAKLEYYEERLDMLSKIDFDQTHTLIIEHCVNDYALQIPPEQVGDALRDIIKKLQHRYPDMDIWISSPTYCYIVVDGVNVYCDTQELGPYMLEAYVQIEEQICKEMGVGFVDNYHQDVITRETMDNYYLDGLHLNEAGRRVIADNILKAVAEKE